MDNYCTGAFYGLKDHGEFIRGIQHSVNQLTGTSGLYASDNLFTINRNLSFLGDEKLMAAFHKHALTDSEKSILWRNSIVAWAARNGMRLEGDFVEVGCSKGTTVRIVCDYIDFASYADRHYYLYEHDSTMPHHALPEHSKELYASVQQRFAEFPNVTVTQGKVPEILTKVSPQKIAFMHIGCNNAAAEVGALEVLFDRMVPGAILVFDDYGWQYYREQKLAEDPWLEKRGYRVAELPTGQGLLIK